MSVRYINKLRYWLYFTYLSRSRLWKDLHHFGTVIGVADIITCDRFLRDWLRGMDSVHCWLQCVDAVGWAAGRAYGL